MSLIDQKNYYLQNNNETKVLKKIKNISNKGFGIGQCLDEVDRS